MPSGVPSAKDRGSEALRFKYRRHLSPAVLVLGVAVALAGLFTGFQIPLTAAQAVSLPARYVAGPVPVDPTSTAWSEATPLTVALAAQLVQIPQGGGRIQSLTARAMFNGTHVAILVEWQDPTRDALTGGSAEFSDGVAVQLVSTSDGQPPFVCMGQSNFQTQVWHWKAERDLLAGGNMSLAQFYREVYGDWYPFENESTWYPGVASGNYLSLLNSTPVEVLVAGGAGTLTSTNQRTVFGAGFWSANTWRVVFVRSLEPATPDEVPILPGVPTAVSFAAWDGSNGDRNGQKSVSSWYEMNAAVPGGAGPWEWLLRIVLGAALFLLILFLFIRRRKRERVRMEGESGSIGLDGIPDEPADEGRREFLQATGVVAAVGVVSVAPGAGLLEDPSEQPGEPDWPAKRKTIQDAFEAGYREPDHLR